jgi:hypothetical protein
LVACLGGDLEGEGPGVELVVPEEVGVVGPGEVGRQLGDLGLDGFADGPLEVVDLGLLLGTDGSGRHGKAPPGMSGFLPLSPIGPSCTKIPPTFVTLTGRRCR